MSFEVPEGLSYLESHEWVRVEDGSATIGITDFAQDELGDVVFVELPEVGTNLNQQEQFGSIESIKAVSDLHSPVTGEVIEVNDRLGPEPELVNDDPYGDAWMLRIDLAGTLDEGPLLSVDEYREQTE